MHADDVSLNNDIYPLGKPTKATLEDRQVWEAFRRAILQPIAAFRKTRPDGDEYDLDVTIVKRSTR